MMKTMLVIILFMVSNYNVATDILFSNEREFEQKARREREQILSSDKVKRKIRRIVIDPGHGGFDPLVSGQAFWKLINPLMR